MSETVDADSDFTRTGVMAVGPSVDIMDISFNIYCITVYGLHQTADTALNPCQYSFVYGQAFWL